MLERERAHLLRQIDRMAAHQRTEHPAAAAELRHALRTVACLAGALLRVHLLAGAVDLAAALGLVGAALALGELPVDATLHDVGARLEAEDCIGQIDRARSLALERGDFQFHLTRPPSRRGLRRPRKLSPGPACCPIWFRRFL